MAHVIDDSAFDRAFDRAMEPFFRLLTSEQMRQLTMLARDSSIEHRVAQLADKSQAGELTDCELSEYEAYVRANNLLAVMCGLANRRLRTERP